MAEYKIKDIEQLTGIKAHTIRIWEKRYGILRPNRTETQIRTYGDDELMLLLNIALLNKHGVKISRIAEMNQLEISNRVSSMLIEKTKNKYQEKLVLALIELNEILFRDTLAEIIEESDLEQAFTQEVLPFLERIGVMWMVGSINPAQEHFISNLIRQKIITEIDKLPIPSGDHFKTALLFLPEHEWHEISLLFYHYTLRKKNIKTFYLGQALPYDSVLECIDKLKPSCLVTSWLTSVDERFIISYFKRLHTESGGIQIFGGGYQINLFKDALKKWVRPISNMDEVLQEM
jgi:DNA-binding transcriptional MerR regulator